MGIKGKEKGKRKGKEERQGRIEKEGKVWRCRAGWESMLMEVERRACGVVVCGRQRKQTQHEWTEMPMGRRSSNKPSERDAEAASIQRVAG
jgi:hypothetical protein